MAATIQKVTLEYFPIRGRAEPIRLLLHDAGIAFDDVEVDRETIKSNPSRYIFGRLPICEIDGWVLPQSGAILRYIARRVGYASESFEEEAYADILAGLMDDMDNVYVDGVWADLPADEMKVHLIDLATTQLPKYLGYVEQVFGKHVATAGFLAYKDKPCFSEFILLHHALAFKILRPTILDEFPVLTRWFAMMMERPGIKAYVESGKLRPRISLNPGRHGDEAVC